MRADLGVSPEHYGCEEKKSISFMFTSQIMLVLEIQHKCLLLHKENSDSPTESTHVLNN